MGVDHLQLSSQPHHSPYPLARSCTPALYDQLTDFETPQPGEYPIQLEEAARIRFMRPAGLSKSIAGAPSYPLFPLPQASPLRANLARSPYARHPPPAGHKLGLNYPLNCEPPPARAAADQLEAPPRRFRCVPVQANYLKDLVRPPPLSRSTHGPSSHILSPLLPSPQNTHARTRRASVSIVRASPECIADTAPSQASSLPTPRRRGSARPEAPDMTAGGGGRRSTG